MTMQGALRVITASTVDPFTVADARAFCRIRHTGEDALLGSLIKTAHAWLQPPVGFLGRSVMEQTLRADYPSFPLRSVRLEAPPVTSITSVKYFDAANAEITVDPASYFLDGDMLVMAQGFVAPTVYRRPFAVRVTYVAGVSDPDDLPAPIVQAMKQCVSHWYENRDAVAVVGALNMIPMGAKDLLSPYKLY
jgi:uncharacterized phiE125 gp8 family phage protein